MRRPTHRERLSIVNSLSRSTVNNLAATVWGILDGWEWGAETLDEIAEEFRRLHLGISEPDFYEEPPA